MRCDQSIPPHPIETVDVSIPAGFSDALRPNMDACVEIGGQKFQSLLGFLMRCDTLDAKETYKRISCFNPCWVF